MLDLGQSGGRGDLTKLRDEHGGLTVKAEPCGCVLLVCDNGCTSSAILESTGLTQADIRCDTHKPIGAHVDAVLAEADLVTPRGRAAALRRIFFGIDALGLQKDGPGQVVYKQFFEALRVGSADWDAVTQQVRYQAYLESPGWDRRRRAALRASGYRCQICNKDAPLDVHHRTYERLGHEEPGDLIALCRECHHRHHGGRAA